MSLAITRRRMTVRVGAAKVALARCRPTTDEKDRQEATACTAGDAGSTTTPEAGRRSERAGRKRRVPCRIRWRLPRPAKGRGPAEISFITPCGRSARAEGARRTRERRACRRSDRGTAMVGLKSAVTKPSPAGKASTAHISVRKTPAQIERASESHCTTRIPPPPILPSVWPPAVNATNTRRSAEENRGGDLREDPRSSIVR